MEKLPEDLASMYQGIWERITLGPSKVETAVAVNTLTWMLYAEVPLSPAGLIDAISFGMEKGNLDRDAILHLCYGLVVYDERLAGLRFTHLSVREFLLRQSRFSPDESHTKMAEVCLTMLLASPNSTDQEPPVLMDVR